MCEILIVSSTCVTTTMIYKMVIVYLNRYTFINFDTIPSLKKIKVSQRGAIIYFKSVPENPLEIIGQVSEIKIKYRNKIHSICRNKSNSTIPFSFRKGFLICRDSQINNSDIDCLILFPENTTKLQLNHNFDDVFIIGDQNLSSITIKGTNTINRLIIENCSNLEVLLLADN